MTNISNRAADADDDDDDAIVVKALSIASETVDEFFQGERHADTQTRNERFGRLGVGPRLYGDEPVLRDVRGA
jgi:hypothetical protein